MTADKLKQYIATLGGALGAVLLFLQALGVDLAWFNDATISTFINALLATVPLVMVAYGIYKNTYLVTEKARKQEELLKEKGLK